jgi:UDP-N-acetylglucosamine--N-acetylmuramyl-(pentapeptide) pyrophosphoryl-undecaprenol N-acetylglucosamine transferase
VTAKTILLAAGGTGGHLFPAFALAEELGRRGWRIELATDHRGDRYGADFPAAAVHQLSSATITGRSPVALARTGFALLSGIRQAMTLIGKIKPSAVVGFGGYPCFPPLAAARLKSVPSALHEQNAVLGRANRLLAPRVSALATSFETVKFVDGALREKVRLTGNPVRGVVLDQAAVPYPALDPGGSVRLLVFGGSQGARYFSNTVPAALERLSDEQRSRLHVTQQCRPEDLDRVRQAYAATGIAADCDAFFADLPARMAASHLVIARAGASSIAELTVIGRPSILVPLPHALDNDQLLNASSLASAGGAWCIEEKDLDEARLAGELAALIEDPPRLVAAAGAACRQGRPDAVTALADLVEELAESKAVRAA